MKFFVKNKLPKISVEPEKVSVIITNFKNEKFLKKAVSSCLKQSYSNLEIIVVDDNSNKDFCIKLLKSFKDNRIRFIYTTRNYGPYACTNYALDAATGKYVTFVDADDWIAEDHIENLIIKLNNGNFLAVFCNYSRVKPDGTYVKRNALCEASLLFDRKLFLKDIGYYHMVRYAADTEYRERAIAFYGSSKIGYLNSCSYTALWSKDSLTASANTKRGSRVAYVRIFRKKHKEFKRNNKLLSDIKFDYKKNFKPFNIANGFDVQDFSLTTFTEEPL